MEELTEHVVFFTGPEGAPTFRRLPSLDEGVRAVEHLRNVDGVADAALFSLAEVPLTVRTYYRVEVAGRPTPAEEAPVAEEPAAPVEPEAPAAEDAAEVDEEVPSPREEPAPTGRRGLAFFAS